MSNLVQRMERMGRWRAPDEKARAVASWLARQAMADALTPDVRRLAEQITGRRDGRDHAGIARAVTEWMRANVRYVRDPLVVEEVSTSRAILAHRAADCDGSVLVAALLLSVGIPVRVVLWGPRDPGPFTHVFVEAHDRRTDRWVDCDWTVPAGFWQAVGRMGRIEPLEVRPRSAGLGDAILVRSAPGDTVAELGDPDGWMIEETYRMHRAVHAAAQGLWLALERVRESPYIPIDVRSQVPLLQSHLVGTGGRPLPEAMVNARRWLDVNADFGWLSRTFGPVGLVGTDRPAFDRLVAALDDAKRLYGLAAAAVDRWARTWRLIPDPAVHQDEPASGDDRKGFVVAVGVALAVAGALWVGLKLRRLTPLGRVA